MEYYSVVVFVAGALIGFFIHRLIYKSSDTGHLLDIDPQALRDENLSLKKDKEHLESRIEKSIEEFGKQKEKEQMLQDEKIQLSSDLIKSKTEYEHLDEKLGEQKKELEQLQEKFTKEFKLIADDLLKKNTSELAETNQKRLDEILSPLKENIKSFEKKVEDKYEKELKERTSLIEQIKSLSELNHKMSEDAQNLTKALKGESKTQGNWGEMVLERILESSGLVKDREYETQFSDVNIDDDIIRPDVVVHLPEGKHIIIDAKVSLTAYEKMINLTDEEERLKQLKLHIQSVRNHVKQLSDKNYSSGKKVNSPDFVLLFMPIEPSFSIAAQEDENLFLDAWSKKVVIVSPSTLLATLRTIASVWKQDRQVKNALEIGDMASKMYNKFVSFIEDLEKIDKGLNSAQNAYGEAINKLSKGKGNLIGRAEKIREMGVKTSKTIPENLINDTEDE